MAPDPEKTKEIHFLAATVFARDIGKPVRVSGASHDHRTNRIKVGRGWIVIEREYYPASKK
ncbi:MAG TPA: hypothetical protein VE130_10565 [Nitrososphaeraceae archaeon]|nr:hypothetical protein [Nitrososphaeraceae archaeon]